MTKNEYRNTLEDFRDWVDDEGGYQSLWNHGVHFENDVPDEIKDDWTELSSLFEKVDEVQRRISAKIGF